MPDYRGKNIEEVVRKAVDKVGTERKARVFDSWAGPMVWGPWLPVWAQYGTVGPERDGAVRYVRIRIEHESREPSSFDIEIKGGDEFIRSLGPGTEIVKVTGNVATELKVRCRSHSPHGLKLIIVVS